ncbi:MAG TPA: DUF222 domain-containing protein [Nocardioidaceae bacterium]|nr:DUF222 domain-containing protein [Nocardioidaceae bacterium]
MTLTHERNQSAAAGTSADSAESGVRSEQGQPATGGSGSGPRDPGGHPVVAFVESLAAGLDRLGPVAAWSMTPAEQRRALVALERQQARLAELRLRVLAAADRNQVGADSGATSTPAWLAHATKTTRQACFRDLHLAEALDGDFEATRRALAAGEIDVDKARIIINAVRDLTEEYDDLPAGVHAEAEAHLLEKAVEFDAPGLRMCGRRLFEVVCPGAADAAEGKKLAEEEERARRTASLSMRDHGDGTVEGRFRLPTLHAGLLKKAVQALTAPRRIGEARTDPKTGKKLPAPVLAGQGLMELLEKHLNLDSMPSVNGSTFTVVVTIPLEFLCSGLGVAVTDVGVRVSAGELRRLACDAGIIPLMLAGDSMPLDLGREQRLFGKGQKIALNHVYGGCAAANCDRPPAWVEYHHKKPWAKGGRTDLADGIPLCPPHHQMADHPETWTIHYQPDGTVRFHRRT